MPRNPARESRVLALVCGSIAVLLAACGADEGATQHLPLPDAGAGAADGARFSDAGATDGAPSAGSDGGVGAADSTAETTGGAPGLTGSPCESNDECDSNVCIDTPKGPVCAGKCVDTCTASFACKQLPGSDAGFYCLPRWLHACEPCTTSSACQAPGFAGAACVDRGAAGSFCGTACDDSGDCPAGSACALVTSVEGTESQQCLPKAGAPCGCSPRAAQHKLTTPCTVALAAGVCQGQRGCGLSGEATQASALSPCDAKPAVESCNGADDDCDGDTDEGLCDDANACTTDRCDPALQLAGGCTTTAAPGACDADGNACTEGDACAAGVCKAGPTKVCDDGNPCTLDACLPATGCTQTLDDGKSCSDGDACTVGDVCLGGSCSSGKATSCTASGFCVVAACDPAVGACEESAKPAGTPCTDDNACTAADTCKAGSCLGQAVVCDDQNPCTSDSCHPALGCQSKPSPQPCDDGNACTAADVCSGGLCSGKPVNAQVWCDDGNPCTTDTCDPKGGAASPKAGCLHGANQLACDDGNACTAGDVCSGGACKPGTNTCQCSQDSDCASKEDGDLCNGTLFCDKSALPYKCGVNPTTVVSCSKAEDTACTAAKCAPKTGKCSLASANEGQPCDADGSVCTVGDLCLGGACKPGKALACDDGNPCTQDSCDAKSGCKAAQLDDKAPCGTKQWCMAGACVVSAWCGDGKVNQGGEQCDDGNTQDGDGCSAKCLKEAAIPPKVGSLVVSEIMADPDTTEKYGEWFEVHNPGTVAIQITGLQIGDGFGKEVVKTQGLILEPGGYFVFANSSTLGGGGKADYVYNYSASSIALSNKGDSVKLVYQGQTIDSVTYGGKGWPTVPSGKTYQLSPTALTAESNNLAANWCYATQPFGTQGAKGTPGAPNTACK